MDKENDPSIVSTPDVSTPLEAVEVSTERSIEEEPRNPWKRVRRLALRQLDRFMSLEPKVLRGDDPDAIHDLRVASRRLQQILDLLYPRPCPAEIRKLRRKIRRCRRALGEVRNCDVQLQHVERVLAAKRTTRREAWEAVRHYLRQRRSASFEKSLRKLSRVNLAVFYVHLKGCLFPDGTGPTADRASQRTELPDDVGAEQFYERIGQSLERVWHRIETQIADSHRDSSAPVIHGVRIAAKRVRYLIEVIHEFDVPGTAKTLAQLRALQQLLGDWHDLEVLEQMIIEMVARAEFLRDHLPIAMEAERLILRNRINKESTKQKYFRMTMDSEVYQEMKDWAARLVASPAAAFDRS